MANISARLATPRQGWHRLMMTILAIHIAPAIHVALAGTAVAQQEQTGSPQVTVEGAILKTIDSTTISAQTAGIIQELKVKEGSRVKAGNELARVKDKPLRLKLAQLLSQVERAKKELANDIDTRLAEKAREVAETEYERALEANERVADTYPLNEIDRLRLVADKSRLEVERTLHEKDLAKFDVTTAISEYRQTYELFLQHQVKAPVDGVVVSVSRRAGEWVEPGTELLEIVRLDVLRVEGFVHAQDARAGLQGKSASVQVRASETTTLQGEVVFVSPDVNPVNSRVRVFIEIENKDGKLRPGSPVEAFIDSAE